MKKLFLFITLMLSTLGFAQAPTGPAPTPPTRAAANVISIFTGVYADLAGTNFNPNWGQTGFASASSTYDTGGGNLALHYPNFNYQGIQYTESNITTMEFIHIDIWTSGTIAPKFYVISAGQDGQSFSIPNVSGSWQSFDIPLSTFSNIDKTKAFQFKFDQGSGTNTIYVDNLYFWKSPPPVGTPVIGPLTVPAKKVGDAPFNLVNPTSDSPGAFSYVSGNTAVATISGNTVTIVGAGTSEITANQAASPPYIAGSVKANLVVQAAPTVAAPTPPNRNVADVKSIYSNAYTPIATLGYTGDVDTYNTSWCGGVTSEVMVAGNATHQVTGLGCEGVAFQSGRFDATAFTHFHMDIWTASPTLDKSFNVKFSNWNGGAGEANAIEYSGHNGNFLVNPNPGTWISIDIPLSSWTAVNGASRNDLVQFVISSNLGTVYYDNLYLYKGTPLSTSKFDASSVKMYPNPVQNTLYIDAESTISSVTVYNVLGQEVLSVNPKSNSAALQTSSLSKGVYLVKTEIDGNISTSKFMKK